METVESRISETEERYRQRRTKRNRRGRNLRTLGDGGDWREIDEPARVTERLIALGLTDVVSEALGRDPALLGDSVVLERIIQGNQLLGADFFLRGAMASRSVGRVVVRSPAGAVLGFGTGLLVTPRLMMTNNHVLGRFGEAAPSTIQFDYVSRNGAAPAAVKEFALDPSVFFTTNDPLDYAIVAVAPVSSGAAVLTGRPWNPMFGASGKAIVGERLNIIQHPAGRPQEASIRDNRIVDVFDTFLHYSSDTEQGSSGSPAFNDQWMLTALHHSGVPKRNDAGRILLISGEPWDGSEDDIPLIAWVANEGIRISSIVAHLIEQADTFSGQSRDLLDELLAAPKPPLLDPFEDFTPSSLPGANGPVPLAVSTGVSGRIDDAGRVHWVVPLEVTAALGAVTTSHAVNTAHPVTPAPVVVPGVDRTPEVDQAALATALARVADAQDRPYFDPEANRANVDAYYGTTCDDLDGTELFDRLSGLVSTTHHTQVRYRNARLDHLYPWVDLQPPPDLNLVSVYSGKGFEPEELIRMELAIEARRDEMLREFTTSEQFSGEDALEGFLDQLEAAQPFNCEHVVPQSWFNKVEPMKGDMHHLFTCESRCNSFRSNIPFFQFGPEDEVVRTGCGRREDTKFEPEAGKGAAARATLYFLLRYPGLIGDEGRELSRDRLDSVILRWHNDDPAGEWEQHRNAAIAQIQGNRNPLIDHPEWAERIDFLRGFGG